MPAGTPGRHPERDEDRDGDRHEQRRRGDLDGSARRGSRGEYAERLAVPLRWWVQSTMLLASLWLAFVVAMPAWAAFTAAGLLLVLVFGSLLRIGSARVRVSDGVLHAGPAHISLDLLGTPEPLDAEGTRRVHGVDADARAFLLTRPYLKRSVRVPVRDPADPTPYWLISTRHPDRLARALSARPSDGPSGGREASA